MKTRASMWWAPGHAVGGRRALVEDPLGAALGLFEALGEDLALAPEVEHGVLEGGQVDLGGHLAVLRRCHVRASSGGRLPLPSEGREPDQLPRYHPPWPRACAALGPLIGVRCRVYWPAPVAAALSSGGSGVIFTARSPPGSHRPRVAPGCVRRYSSHPCLSLRPVYGAVRADGRPVVRGRRGRRGVHPNGHPGRQESPESGRGGLPRGELGTTVAGAPLPGSGEGRTGGVPRCRGAGVDLSSQHDSRARSQYVKGPRPWWRRRPPYRERRPRDPRLRLPRRSTGKAGEEAGPEAEESGTGPGDHAPAKKSAAKRAGGRHGEEERGRGRARRRRARPRRAQPRRRRRRPRGRPRPPSRQEPTRW